MGQLNSCINIVDTSYFLNYGKPFMHTQAKIQKWGNGLAIRVAGVMRDIPKFEAGTVVDVEVTEEGLLIRRQAKTKVGLPFSEADILRGLNANAAHSDEVVHLLPQEIPNE